MDERRSTKRQRVLKAGSIQIGAGGAIDCTVRNPSHSGAALDVQSQVGFQTSSYGPYRATDFASPVAWPGAKADG